MTDQVLFESAGPIGLITLNRPQALNALTLEMIQVLEARIREHPDQWLCSNRRWPKQVMRERGVY